MSVQIDLDMAVRPRRGRARNLQNIAKYVAKSVPSSEGALETAVYTAATVTS
jgi:hypothetical protein